MKLLRWLIFFLLKLVWHFLIETDELNSFMYQSVGHELIEAYGACMELPLYRRGITGSAKNQEYDYKETLDDEVEDLYCLLKSIKKEIPSVEAVSSGAILSNYQRLRVENVCSRLGLVSLAFLWNSDQKILLDSMISSNLNAILIKVAVMGLKRSHLGKSIQEMRDYLFEAEQKYGINVCGEGGEFETITLDCPLFKKKIIM